MAKRTPTPTQEWCPQLFPKQFPVFQCRKRYVLLSGPKKSGKTVVALHRICRHLWETTNDKVAFIVKTQKSSKTAGAWDQLIRYTIPEWIASGIGFEFTSFKRGMAGPIDDPSTKMPMFRVTNMHGNESECFLFSLNNDDEVIAKVFSNNFKMIYVSEVQNFTTDAVFAKAVNQLRDLDDPTGVNCMWLGDTNPTDEGEASWIYQMWFVQRLMENHRSPVFQAELALFEIFMEDNPTLTQRDYEEIREMCGQDDELFQRWCKGVWKSGGMMGRHFAKYFMRSKHVLGDASDPNEDNWEVALPKESPGVPCLELVGCWDIGDVNHAAQILQKIPVNPPLNPSGLHYYQVLEELVYIGENVSIEAFVEEFLALMDRQEQLLGHSVLWKHWSDPDVSQKFHSGINGYYDALVRRFSQGRIDLVGVPKERDTVRPAVTMIKNLLAQGRLLVSAHCFKTIEMFEDLRKGAKPIDFVPRFNHPPKHPFDSLRYGLQMEVMEELDYSPLPEAGRRELIRI